MKELRLIEPKIEEIRKKLDEGILQEKDGKYPVLQEIQEEIKSLVVYIRDKREKWIKAIIDILGILEEKLKIEKSKTTENAKKDKLEKLTSEIYGLKEGIKREFLYDPDNVIEKLKSDGRKILNNSSLTKAIDGIGFKLLEKIRLGQRDEVMYLLLRTFKAHNQKLPDSLIEALKTKWEDGLFKSFMYAFLSPILGKETKPEGGES